MTAGPVVARNGSSLGAAASVEKYTFQLRLFVFRWALGYAAYA